MYGFIARYVMAPTLDLLRGTQTMKCLEELEKSQWWPREEILELQNQRLGNLAKYAYDHVPYYRRIFDERGLKPKDIATSRDLIKLPVLTKQVIRENFGELQARGFPSKQRIELTTGGSTGEPLVFYSTLHDHSDLSFAARQRARTGIGYELGDKNVEIRINLPHKSAKERFWRKPIELFRRSIILDVMEMYTDKMPIFAKKLEDFQPKFIDGYPSAIYQLTRFIQAEGKPRLRPRAIVTGAEMLYDHQRKLFREVFGCDTYDFYGSNEQHLIAFECQQHSGYHTVAENVIVEIVGNEDNPVATGKEGRILITSLHNYAMPFIRYDIGDVGVSSDKSCPCGRGLPLLAVLKGRATDIIVTKSRGQIPGITLLASPQTVLAHLGVEQFQIFQETYGKVTAKLVLSDECPVNRGEEVKREIVKEYKHILGEDMDIAVEFVDEILPTAAGKTKLVISNLPPVDAGNP